MYNKILNCSAKRLLKYMGVLFIIASFLIVMATKDSTSMSNIDVLIKPIFSLLFVVGLFYIILVDTSFFKAKPICSLLNKNIDSLQLEVRLLAESKIIKLEQSNLKRQREKYSNKEEVRLQFKTLPELIEIVKSANTLFNANTKNDVLRLLECGKTDGKIELLKEKHVFTYKPIFDFFDKVVVGGINALYGNSRRELLRFISNNFVKTQASSIDIENLRKRYQDWLDKENLNSDIFLVCSDIWGCPS